MLSVSSIEPHPHQPRRYFDEEALAELGESIRSRGLIQPIVVRPFGQGYQIVAGERRWRAAQKARLHEIPALVRDFDDVETRSEEHTSELQSLMRISYAVFCLKKKKTKTK